MYLSYKRLFLVILLLVSVSAFSYWTFTYFYLEDDDQTAYYIYMWDNIKRENKRIQDTPYDITQWLYRKWMKPERAVSMVEQRLEEHYAMEDRYPINVWEVVGRNKLPDVIRLDYERVSVNSYQFTITDEMTGQVITKSRRHE